MYIFSMLLSCSEQHLMPTDKALSANEDSGSIIETDADVPSDPGECSVPSLPREEIGIGDSCPEVPVGGFDPIVEWTFGANKGCLSLPVVADINKDGMPDVLINLTDMFLGAGTLSVVSGDGSGEIFNISDAQLAYGSPVAVADIDKDGFAEIIGIREHATGLFAPVEYSVVAWNSTGQQLWESEHFINVDFNWATAPIIADMDADGIPEIIAGRVILRPDGTTRGIGAYGQGSYGRVVFGDLIIVEGSVPAVADLDLDGYSELVVGNARYDADGNALFYDPSAEDGMIAIANLDSDLEGEVIATTRNSIRAIDTDGQVLWGPIVFPAPANILSPPTIADVDGDGYPEILTAGGNELRCFNHDGSLLWSANVVDESGATGASVFDFEGDGNPEVVYIDELAMHVFDGATGGIKFSNSEHSSNTMFDYPVIVDVDGDDEAEILVCHNGFSSAFSVYGDANNSWMPARPLWNQHAYHINNIQDNLQIPVAPLPSFVHSNTWHSAVSTTSSAASRANLEPELLDVCTDECDSGVLWLSVRLKNTGETQVPIGTNLSVYALDGNMERQLSTFTVTEVIEAGWSSESFQLGVYSEDIEGMTGIRIRADDDGTGTGAINECSELDNTIQSIEAVCP
jgi:hypothetical protein